MKIESIVLENFFGYRGKHEIPFDEFLTLVKGENDNGKSTILHAIRWITHNEPKGPEVIWRNDQGEDTVEQEKKASVTIFMKDGSWVKKNRTKTKTSYETSNTDGSFETSEIPKEVIDILGIKNYKLGTYEADINFLFQHDKPMILADSPGEGAAVLGYLANTELIDNTATRIEKASKSYKREINAAEKEVDTLKEKASEYDLVDEYLEDVKDLKKRNLLLEIVKDKSKEMSGLHFKHSSISEDLENKKEVRKKLYPLEGVVDKKGIIEEKYSLYKTLEHLNKISGGLNEELEELKKELKKLSDVDITKNNYEKVILKDKEFVKISSLEKSFTSENDDLKGLCQINSKIISIDNMSLKNVETVMGLYNKMVELDIRHKKEMTFKEGLLIKKEFLKDVPSPSVAAEIDGKIIKLKEVWSIENKYKKLMEDHKVLSRDRELFEEIPGDDNVSRLELLIERYEDVKNSEKKYKIEKDNLTHLKDKQKKTEEWLEEQRTELEDLWNSVGGICPTCELPIERH